MYGETPPIAVCAAPNCVPAAPSPACAPVNSAPAAPSPKAPVPPAVANPVSAAVIYGDTCPNVP